MNRTPAVDFNDESNFSAFDALSDDARHLDGEQITSKVTPAAGLQAAFLDSGLKVTARSCRRYLFK